MNEMKNLLRYEVSNQPEVWTPIQTDPWNTCENNGWLHHDGHDIPPGNWREVPSANTYMPHLRREWEELVSLEDAATPHATLAAMRRYGAHWRKKENDTQRNIRA